MKMYSIKKISITFCILLYAVTCFSQQVQTVNQALNRISYSNPPYKNAKWTEIPILELFPPTVEGLSDKLYEDLQCTKFFYASEIPQDLSPSLYMKFRVPNSNYTLGALIYGGATDFRVDKLFIADDNGNIKSSIDTFIGIANVSIRQFELTKEYKVIIYQLIPLSNSSIMFGDLIGQDNKTVQCYRLDTIYHINSNGQFEKEEEKKYPIKNYTVKQLTDLNAWEL